MEQMKIAIAGTNGRMGRMLVQAVAGNPAARLTGALGKAGSDALGLDAGYAAGIKTGVAVTDNPAIALAEADVLIDFPPRCHPAAFGEMCRQRHQDGYRHNRF